MKVFMKFYMGFSRLNHYMALVAAYSLGIMMLLTTVDVLGRYFFNRPLKGTFEIVGFTLVIAMGWALAYCQLEKKHITATFITEKFPQKIKEIINVLSYFLGFCVFSVITWQAVELTKSYLIKGTVSVTLKIPYAPFVGLLVFASLLLTIAFLLDVIRGTSSFFRKEQSD